MKEILDYCAKTLRANNITKFQCSLANTEQQEMSLEGTNFTLIRTMLDHKLEITIINNNQKGSISLNRIDHNSIDGAIAAVIELANSSQQDPDYDISPPQPEQTFKTGPLQVEEGRMYELLKEYSRQVPEQFPEIILMETALVHKHTLEHFINSNGVEFVTNQGVYTLSSVFSSRRGEKATSFNYSGFAMADLDLPLLERAALKTLLQQSVEHLEAQPLRGKFVGDVILTPECLHNFIYFYTGTFLDDGPMIGKTSPFRNKLGQKVADSKITLSAQPTSTEMAAGYFVTNEGFAAKDATFIEEGVLKSFLLSQYGAKKTGFSRALNQGGCWVLEPGEQNLQEMVSQVERGLLVARYSGGAPSPNGDFSGVAKNSYYIENGKIMYPITETMVAGNLADVFLNVKGISQERTNFGYGIIPYLLTSGVTISGK